MSLEFFEKGLDFESYLAKADMNVPTMKENFNEIEISSDDTEFFRRLQEKLGDKRIRILAISESWCGDCVENLPIVAKLASLFSFFDLKIFPRDENLEIMDLYLTNGKRTIPVFVFYDPFGKEIGRFIERPKKADEFLKKERAALAGLSQKEKERSQYEIRARLRKMYKEGLRQETIKEIRSLFESWLQKSEL